MDDATPEVFKIPAHRMHLLEARIEKFARKAAKLGQTPVTFEVVGEKLVQRVDETGRKTNQVDVFKLVTLQGTAPVVNGYTFVARTEHTPAGNIISRAPGAHEIPIPTELRDAGSYCDHCKTARERLDTFILREDASGNLIRVGRNCLADFIRDGSAASALSVWAIIADFHKFASADEDGGFGFSGNPNYDLLDLLATAFRSVDVYGWVSKSAAQERDDVRSTADATSWASERPSFKGMSVWEAAKLRAEWEAAQPTEANVDEAKAAIEWSKTLNDSNDYEHNLKVACSWPYVTPRNFGLVVSLVTVYRRFQEREFERNQPVKLSTSKHFGTIKGRYVRKLQVTKTYDMHGDYGLTVLYSLVDSEGNLFKWFSSGGGEVQENGQPRPLRIGDELFFTFGVKAHKDYKGVPETLIERATATETMPSFKWFNPATGEVFKTKKAMAAV